MITHMSMMSIILTASISRDSVGISAQQERFAATARYSQNPISVWYTIIIKCVLLIRVIIFVCRLLHADTLLCRRRMCDDYSASVIK